MAHASTFLKTPLLFGLFFVTKKKGRNTPQFPSYTLHMCWGVCYRQTYMFNLTRALPICFGARSLHKMSLPNHVSFGIPFFISALFYNDGSFAARLRPFSSPPTMFSSFLPLRTARFTSFSICSFLCFISHSAGSLFPTLKSSLPPSCTGNASMLFLVWA